MLMTTANSRIEHRPLSVGYVNVPAKDKAIKLPGYGLSFDACEITGPKGGPEIKHPMLGGLETNAYTLRELRMVNFINQVTDKPDWQRKVFDEAIIAKWRKEGEEPINVDGAVDVHLSPEMFDYVSLTLRGWESG
jgi:hypothetical protein